MGSAGRAHPPKGGDKCSSSKVSKIATPSRRKTYAVTVVKRLFLIDDQYIRPLRIAAKKHQTDTSAFLCTTTVTNIENSSINPVVSTFVSAQLSHNFKDICSLERLAKAEDSGR